jgi:hypothetical protein
MLAQTLYLREPLNKANFRLLYMVNSKKLVFFWKSNYDNAMFRGMVFDGERKGRTPRHTGRSKGHGRDARATRGEPTSRGRFRRRSSSYGGRDEGQEEPIYVSAKRTHRFLKEFSM